MKFQKKQTLKTMASPDTSHVPNIETRNFGIVEVDAGETPMEEENPDIYVHPMAGKTFSDDPDSYECRDLNNNPSQLFHRPEDFHQAIRFIEAHYLK
jgi:hypothetical protein